MNARLARTLTPERRFLLSCARLHVDASLVIERASGVGDWQNVCDEAHRHHLEPFVSRALDLCPVGTAPQHVVLALARRRQESAALNTCLLAEAACVLRAFNDAGLEPVVLKGAALAEALYGEIALRAFCDIDVLLTTDQLDRAEAVLRSMHYEPEPTPHPRSWYFENYYQLPRYARKRAGLCVELHWDFGRRPNPFTVDVDAMRRRAEPVSVAGVAVRRLSPEDQLLHLCLHLAWGNGFSAHLRGLVDISELITSGVDWNVFEQLVIASAASQVVVPSLQLAEWLLDAPVDDGTLTALERRRGGRLSRLATGIGQGRTLSGGGGHLTLMRLCWIRGTAKRYHFLRQNFGEVEFKQFDTRPKLVPRLFGAARRALSTFRSNA